MHAYIYENNARRARRARRGIDFARVSYLFHIIFTCLATRIYLAHFAAHYFHIIFIGFSHFIKFNIMGTLGVMVLASFISPN